MLLLWQNSECNGTFGTTLVHVNSYQKLVQSKPKQILDAQTFVIYAKDKKLEYSRSLNYFKKIDYLKKTMSFGFECISLTLKFVTTFM